MPDYEVSANNIMYQFFPGEVIQGKATVDAAGLHCPIVIPADFYVAPERYKFRQDAFFPTHAIPLSPFLPLYDTTRESGGSLYPEVDDSSSEALYKAPRNWLDTLVYNFISTAAPAPTSSPPFQKHTLYVWRRTS